MRAAFLLVDAALIVIKIINPYSWGGLLRGVAATGWSSGFSTILILLMLLLLLALVMMRMRHGLLPLLLLLLHLLGTVHCTRLLLMLLVVARLVLLLLHLVLSLILIQCLVTLRSSKLTSPAHWSCADVAPRLKDVPTGPYYISNLITLMDHLTCLILWCVLLSIWSILHSNHHLAPSHNTAFALRHLHLRLFGKILRQFLLKWWYRYQEWLSWARLVGRGHIFHIFL